MTDLFNSDDSEEDSETRYQELKKEEAGTNQDKAEKRYQELKEEAKKEFIQRQKEREEEQEEEESEDDPFITH